LRRRPVRCMTRITYLFTCAARPKSIDEFTIANNIMCVLKCVSVCKLWRPERAHVVYIRTDDNMYKQLTQKSIQTICVRQTFIGIFWTKFKISHVYKTLFHSSWPLRYVQFPSFVYNNSITAGLCLIRYRRCTCMTSWKLYVTDFTKCLQFIYDYVLMPQIVYGVL